MDPTPSPLAYVGWTIPPLVASVPAAITTFGSGIASKVRRSGPAMPAVPTPVTSSTSA